MIRLILILLLFFFFFTHCAVHKKSQIQEKTDSLSHTHSEKESQRHSQIQALHSFTQIDTLIDTLLTHHYTYARPVTLAEIQQGSAPIIAHSETRQHKTQKSQSQAQSQTKSEAKEESQEKSEKLTQKVKEKSIQTSAKSTPRYTWILWLIISLSLIIALAYKLRKYIF